MKDHCHILYSWCAAVTYNSILSTTAVSWGEVLKVAAFVHKSYLWGGYNPQAN